MRICILIEPTSDGRFRASAGGPFDMSAEGQTADEAARQLEATLRDRLRAGARLAVIDLGTGPWSPVNELRLNPLPDDDWFFQAMQEVIAENRQREAELLPEDWSI